MREKVFEVAAYAGVLMCAYERDVFICVDAWVEGREGRYDGTSDACVSHCYIYIVGSIIEVIAEIMSREYMSHNT